MWRILPRTLLYRLLFLLIGNIALLVMIRWFLKDGGSFAQVLSRAGPDCAPTILAGLGMTAIVFAGAIDLSIGGIIAVAGTVFGILVHWEAPPLLCHLLCCLTVVFLSSANGHLIRRLGVPAIIVTLGGLTFYRGVALIIADVSIPSFSGNISVHSDDYHGPGKFHASTILAVMLILAFLWEAYSEKPRRWLALGNSEEACRLQGLEPRRVLQSAFLFGGVFLAVGTLLEVTQVQAIEPARIAIGFELSVIGAVVLGGTNIFGGEGCFAGTVLGTFFLYFTRQTLIYGGVSPYLQEVIVGGAIIGVISVDCLLHREHKRMEELR